MKEYIYFFTRQDISPEQQLVQTAHVALELGAILGTEAVQGKHFMCIGARNLDALYAQKSILEAFDIPFIEFREPYLNNQLTSVATWPIKDCLKGPLLAFDLLKFG